MSLKRIAYLLHLWIGMITGVIVFIVCITGAIWALGINGWVGDAYKEQAIVVEDKPLLKPSQLVKIVEDDLRGKHPSFIRYSEGESTLLRLWGNDVNMTARINPYTGEVLESKIRDVNAEYEMTFWDYMRWGHRALWLPWDVGRPIVNYGTMAFAITLITGLYLWIPKSRKGVKNRLTFNWNKATKWKRKMYDFHLVLGFYSCFLLLVLCFTGMVWGIEWWSDGVYKVTTGKELPAWEMAQSDSTKVNAETNILVSIDEVFSNIVRENPNAASFSISFPDTTNVSSAISITVSHNKKVLYNTDTYAFDRYTLKEIEQEGPHFGRYEEKSFGDKLRRQNYDIHIGAVWGIPGRLLMFFAALFGASLPLTGYYVYFKIKKKKKRQMRL